MLRRPWQAAVSAAVSTIKQGSFAGLLCKLGITPMIGVHGDSAEAFPLADAQALVALADGMPETASRQDHLHALAVFTARCRSAMFQACSA